MVVRPGSGAPRGDKNDLYTREVRTLRGPSSMFFGPLGLPKAYPFPSSVFLNEIDSGPFKRSADSCLIRERNRDFPLHNFGSSDGSHANF